VARAFRSTLATSILVAGIACILPAQVGSSGPAEITPVNVVPAAFEIAARRDTLVISGHTASRQHEAMLRAFAARHFPNHEPRFDFRPLGLVPDWWTDVTTRLLAAIAAATLPSAKLAEDRLEIRAFATDAAAVEARLDALRPLLPGGMSLQSRLASTGPALTPRELCLRQFGHFEAGPIRFEESGTALRASAYPELDRVVMLASACRDATVTVTGHTDASGNETWNRQLSLERARAVADYLARRGVIADNIVATGAGSSVPVADNATRYGRSLNRRIEVAFSYGDGLP
jgi:outer membrane protein OmpA-like peptidoglycan-associated protein